MFFNKTGKTLSKPELRAAVSKKCKSLTATDFLRQGKSAAALLEGSELWKKHSTVLAFLSMKDEIDTQPLIQAAFAAHKRLFVPKIAGDDMSFYQLQAGSPLEADLSLRLKPTDFPALVITPGRAFDRQGRRLGRGRGFYDRFFAALDSGPVPGLPYTAIGLCMDCQLVEKVPTEAHDKQMDAVLSGKKLVQRAIFVV